MNFPIFEAIMLLCFGLAWPVSIFTSWTSRTNKGKSILFILIVLVGYISGLIHKLWWQDTIDAVVWLYVLNTVMVLIDIILYIRNLRLDKDKN
jgi:lipopolysaccharide export LptBFGC system permease protein LptF